MKKTQRSKPAKRGDDMNAEYDYGKAKPGRVGRGTRVPPQALPTPSSSRRRPAWALAFIEAMEDQSDLKAAIKARKEKDAVPLAKIKARLGMK
jgi:hypothetical protein